MKSKSWQVLCCASLSSLKLLRYMYLVHRQMTAHLVGFTLVWVWVSVPVRVIGTSEALVIRAFTVAHSSTDTWNSNSVGENYKIASIFSQNLLRYKNQESCWLNHVKTVCICFVYIYKYVHCCASLYDTLSASNAVLGNSGCDRQTHESEHATSPTAVNSWWVSLLTDFCSHVNRFDVCVTEVVSCPEYLCSLGLYEARSDSAVGYRTSCS